MWATIRLLIAAILIAAIIPLSDLRVIQNAGGMGSTEVKHWGRHYNQVPATGHIFVVDGTNIPVDASKLQLRVPGEVAGEGWSSSTPVPSGGWSPTPDPCPGTPPPRNYHKRIKVVCPTTN